MALNPARDGRERSAHQKSGRQQADGAHNGAKQDRRAAVANAGNVDPINQWHADADQKPADADAQFDGAVNEHWMIPVLGEDARQRETAEAQAAHEGGEKNAERNRGRADDELEQLVPDNFIDQCGTAAGGEEDRAATGDRVRRSKPPGF